MKPWQIFLYGSLFGIIAIAVILIVAFSRENHAIILPDPVTPVPVAVFVTGCVAEPGVYHLAAGSRSQDAVQAAGGFTSEANTDAVNLASLILDGQKIQIPEKNPSSPKSAQNPSDGSSPSPLKTTNFPININTAGVQELDQLPGIGTSKAEDIIAFREREGYFLTIEDILKVPGIGNAIFSEIKDLITTVD